MFWFLVLVAAVAVVYYILSNPYNYWTNLGVKQGKPVPFFGDSWRPIIRRQCMAEMSVYYYNMCPGTRYSGFYQFHMPTLMLRDPDILKQITIKDFEHFTDHKIFLPEESDPLWVKNLFALTGNKWRNMRTTLSPAFTSSNMRTMFVLMMEVTENFTKYLTKQNQDVIEIDMKDTFTRFTNDVIATTAFGIQVDSLNDKTNEFYMMGKEATNMSVLKSLKILFLVLLPKLYKYFNVTLMGTRANNFFIDLIKNTIRTREEKNIVRPDLINLLMEARKCNHKHNVTQETVNDTFAVFEDSDNGKRKVNMEITDIDIAAQGLVFFFAGFDTVSGLMCFTSYELATHPDIQTKLRNEINDTLNDYGGKIDYEALNKMKYMNMVISEVLRKWPTAPAVDRVCTKPYTIEPVTPEENSVHLDVGAHVWLPIYAIHHDPQYFSEPERFDPERFSDENKSKILPYTYLPFGLGQRNCIGSRFALMETKAVMTHLLANFEIIPVARTKIPLKLSNRSLNLAAEGGFWFGLKRIQKN